MPYQKKRQVRPRKPMVKRKPAVRVPRRPFKKPAFKRRVGPKPNMVNARSQLLNVLTVPNYYDYQRADQFTIPASTTALGIPCQYGHEGIASSLFPSVSRGVQQMAAIAFIITPSVQQSIKFFQTRFSSKHMITNQSNAFIRVTGYLCRARYDIPNQQQFYPINRLGEGFASSGINAAQPNASNTGMNQESLSPFQSPDFCQTWKIVKVLTHKVVPGGVCEFSQSDLLNHTIRPNRYLSMSAGATYGTATQNSYCEKGGSFWLFKFSQDQLGDRSAATSNLQSVAMNINMLTTSRWEYKYVPDIEPNINSIVSNIQTATGTTNIMSRYTGVASVEATV